jgi:hypothetical protein
MAFQSGGFQAGGFQQGGAVVSSTTGQPGAGSAKRRRKYKQKHFVTIDGKDYAVASLADAMELLAEAREEVAEAVAEKQPVKLPRIRVKGPKGPELLELVEMVSHERELLRAAYANVQRDAEIARLMYEAAEQDDEDALLALFH